MERDYQYVRMKIENSYLEKAHFEAWVHFSNAENKIFYRARIIGIDENERYVDLLGRYVDTVFEEDFDDMPSAINWLEQKAKKLVVEELEWQIKKATPSQICLDNIKQYGFEL